MSATIWFWNWLVVYLEATQKPDSNYLKLAKKLPKASPRLDDAANVQRSRKISLWKTNWFSDIFFLWAVWLNPELNRIVFDTESPTITANRFDPNWKLFFLWYTNQQFLAKDDNFWKKYFLNDIKFWDLIKNFSQQLNNDITKVDNDTKANYLNYNTFSPTSYELFLSQNYFNHMTINTSPLYEKYGSSREIYENILHNSKIKWDFNPDILWEIFTTTPYQQSLLTFKGLWDFNKEYKKKNIIKLKNKKNQIPLITNIFLDNLKHGTWFDLVHFLFFNFNVPLQNFSNFENFEFLEQNILLKILSKPITTDQLIDIFNRYNFRLCALENEMGLYEKSFRFKFSDPLTLGYLVSKIIRRLDWLENFQQKKGFVKFLINEIPSVEELKFLKRKHLKLSNFTTTVEKKTLLGTLLPKETNKSKSVIKKKPIYLIPSIEEVKNFLIVEAKLRLLERQFNLWPLTANLQNSNSFSNHLKPSVDYPWYIWSLKYFGKTEYRYVLPGFIRYYTPTPYPSSFSTFGFTWQKYQFFRKNVSSTLVGYSDSVAELKNSTPIALYSGVEAILYIKSFLQIFDFFVKIFIKCITYPIEFIITQTTIPQLNSILSLAFFIHLVWFIHFYIYFFVAIYLLYYAIIYYHWKVGFLWFYEWMFEENFFSQYTSKIYWHSISDIWLNYKTPDQLYFFAIHTNLLLHYTFFNYNQFFYLHNNNVWSIISLLVSSTFNKISFSDFLSNLKIWNSKNFQFQIFKSFYNARVKKYSILLFNGGFDCSFDHLIWTYFDYLTQISNFFTRSVWQKIQNINQFSVLISEIKQFTILISSMSLNPEYLFFSNPVLDTVLSRKLFINLCSNIFNLFPHNNNLQISLNDDKLLMAYVFYTGYQFDCNLQYTTSAFDVYKIFENKFSNILSKLGTDLFWDKINYWILIFFWSFRFVPWTKFPFLNFHQSHEINRLQLGWIAYSNSWIGQSMYTWPFFNLIQHIWWTSKLYNWSFSLISTPLNLNQSGLQIIDNVRNFYEKWYSIVSSNKVETIFGLVRTINLSPVFYLENYGPVPYVNKNFDLTFPDETFDKRTTERSYLKTNPPLDLCELGITPSILIDFFKILNPRYVWFYLSFFSQLTYLNLPSTETTRDLKNEFNNLTLYEGVADTLEHSFYSKYEFYLKRFDFEFQYSANSPLANWVFTFDTSYFLSHFKTWDYFTPILSSTWNQKFNISETALTSQELNTFFTNFDMLASLNIEENWFKKPFGSLDKFELFSQKKFKATKTIDINSFTWHREDPFLNLDKEHTSTFAGLSVYPKEDKKNLEQSYSEDFAGYRQKRFPFNPSIVKNVTPPLIIGWVGELYISTVTATSYMYSMLYATPKTDILAWNASNNLDSYSLILGGKYHSIKTFFFNDNSWNELLSWSFTWLNLFLHPISHWYSFGPKALAWLDYWSWKSGITFDYNNGLYSYWPYLGYRHSFATKLTPYDPLYGFYNSYRQIYDNPLVIDLSTGAADIFRPKDDEEIIQEIKDSEKSTDPDFYTANLDVNSFADFSVPYRELYYSFHHPFFIGYLFFWTLVFSSSEIYLGIVNFSHKRLLLREFLINNTLFEFNFENLSNNRLSIENWFWKQMFKYWIFYSNPIYFTGLFDCGIDDEILQPIDNDNTMYNYYQYNQYLFSYFLNSFKLTTTDIYFLLDLKKVYSHVFLTNWLTLDLPFPINPYTVTTFFLTLTTSQKQFYQTHHLSFSYYDSLWENYNFNLFYDWSTGTYLDTINMISYLGCFKGTSQFSSIFENNQSFLSASTLRLPTDKSKQIAKELISWTLNFNIHDLLIFPDYALHNFSILEFFQESIDFVLHLETVFYEWRNLFHILKFYFKNQYFTDYNKYNVSGLVEIDSKISTIITKKWSWIKYTYFLYNFISKFPHDFLIASFTTGLMFTNRNLLITFYNSLRFRLFTWYHSLQTFYNKVGYLISTFFFKKF